ncbi:MAG: UMP kinase [Thermoproteota archaeon]|nr:UMP kinase [Thermoproteota archaeon]
MKLVVRVGGSVVASPVDPVRIEQFVSVLKELKKQGHRVVAVVGGGGLARDFIEIGRRLGLDEATQDEAAILVSRLLAELFVKKLGDFGCGFVPISIEDATNCLQKNKVVVMGGLKPGMTTDTVAAMVAERVNAGLLVKATDQEGIYTKDPKKHEDAEKIDRLSFDDLFRLFGEEGHKVGVHQVLDSEAVKILRRSGVKVVVVSGFRPENVLLAVRGVRVGTLVE